MGKLTEQIRADLTESMKARTAERTSTLRMLQSALKNEQISVGHELSDEEAMAIIRKGIKQRLDSIEQFTKGNRLELAAKEKQEVEILDGAQTPLGASGARQQRGETVVGEHFGGAWRVDRRRRGPLGATRR